MKRVDLFIFIYLMLRTYLSVETGKWGKGKG